MWNNLYNCYRQQSFLAVKTPLYFKKQSSCKTKKVLWKGMRDWKITKEMRDSELGADVFSATVLIRGNCKYKTKRLKSDISLLRMPTGGRLISYLQAWARNWNSVLPYYKSTWWSGRKLNPELRSPASWLHKEVYLRIALRITVRLISDDN